MAYEWQLVDNGSTWQRSTDLTFSQANNGEYGLVVSVDPAQLNVSDHSDASYRTILEAIIAAVVAQGFNLGYASKQEPYVYQLVETEPEPEV